MGKLLKLIGLAALATILAILPPSMPASAQAGCTFKLGFKALHDQIPDVVGDCLGNEYPNGVGDSNQQTRHGLMAWRKADNWTAFTNGATTWINGPYGLASRPNEGPLFDWEAGAGFSTIAGDWWHHGFYLTIFPTGRAEVKWRTYQWCGPGVTGACDRLQGNQIWSGGHAAIQFDRLSGEVALGSVVQTNDDGVLVRGPLTLVQVGYGMAELRQGGEARTLCGPMFSALAPESVRRSSPCGA